MPTSRLTRSRIDQACAALARRDPVLADIINNYGSPPLWGRATGWRSLVRIILEQQVSVASGLAAYQRLATGLEPFEVSVLATTDIATIRALGITRQKARYCQSLAQTIADKRLNLGALNRLPDHEVCQRLQALDGVGPWTAQIYLLMALLRPDVWPDGDLVLRQRLQLYYRVRSDRGRARVSAKWQPWRSVAARLFWHDYLQQSKSK